MNELDLIKVKAAIELAVGGKAIASRVLCSERFQVKIRWSKGSHEVEYDYSIPMFEFKFMSCNINEVVAQYFLNHIRRA